MTQIEKDLKIILKRVAEIEHIENYELIPNLKMDSGDGFLGQLYRGQVKNKNTNELINVICKKRPLQDYGFSVDKLYVNEDRFYKTIYPVLFKYQKEIGVAQPFDNIAKFYCSYPETSTPDYIVMEDLSCQGYILKDKSQFFDQSHLEYLFGVYARFHALSFLYKKQRPEEFQRIVGKECVTFSIVAERLYEKISSTFMKLKNLFNAETDKDVHGKVGRFIDNFETNFFNYFIYKGRYSCLTHGDCWSNNMLFKYAATGKLEHVKLIDFQVMGESTPIHDLSYFFYSATSSEHFDKLDNYLEIYHKTFVKQILDLGGSPDDYFTLEILKNEWKNNAIVGIVMGIELWGAKLMKKETIQLVTNKTTARLDDLKRYWYKMLEKIENSQEYIGIVKGILRHAVEYDILK